MGDDGIISAAPLPLPGPLQDCIGRRDGGFLAPDHADETTDCCCASSAGASCMVTGHKTGEGRYIGRHVTNMVLHSKPPAKPPWARVADPSPRPPGQQDRGHPRHPRRRQAGPAGMAAPKLRARTGQQAARWAGLARTKKRQHPPTAAKAHGRRCSAAKGGWHPGSGNDRQGVSSGSSAKSLGKGRRKGTRKGAGPGDLGQHMNLESGCLGEDWSSGGLADGGGIWHAGGRAHGAAEHGARSGQLRR